MAENRSETDVDALRRRILALEDENARLRVRGADPGHVRDAARIVDEITGADSGTDPFAAAVRATRMPMVISNPRLADNPIVFVNDAFCRLTGYSRDEILGRNCRFLQGAETDRATVARIRAAVERRESVRIDILNYRKTGQTFWNRLLMAPVRDAAGELAYFFASQVDVTLERERLEGLESHNAALMAEVSDQLHVQQESAARLNFAAEAGRLGIWEQDLRTGELTATGITKETFGRDRADRFTSADLDAAVLPDDRPACVAARRHSIEVGADYDVEFRIRAAGGTVRWVHMRAQVMRDDAGQALRMAGVCLDVTARKAADTRRAAMVELGDRIRDIDDPDELAYAAAEILGRTLAVSRAGYGTVDLAAETIAIGRDWNAPGVRSIAGLLHFRDYGSYIDDLKAGRLAAVADARTDPRTAEHADELIAIDARAFLNLPVTESAGLVALLFANHAEVRHWSTDDIGFMRDLAERTRVAIERRRAEASLLALTQSLEAQVDARTRERNRLWATTNDLMATAGLDGMLREVNPAWQRSLGWDRATLLSRPFLDIVEPADHAETLRVIERLARGEVVTGFLDRLRTSEGEYRTLMWNAVPDGQDFFIVGRDVTEQRQAEEALRQSQKMEAVGQLTGGLAHDFNNLLTGISGSLELLGTRVRQGRIDDIERYVVAAQGASKRAAALTHRLLAFSRRQTLDPRPTDVNRLVHDIADLIRRTVGPEIALEVVGTVGLWTALVDPNQLENALLNLAINARDAMPDGGRLTVETGNRWMDERAARERDLPPGQYLSLCVSDTGTGMAPDIVARAFDPFFTTKPLGQGTGLGLSMIYGFARQSGGQVRIYSEVGEGTMVCIYLPRHYGEGGDAAAGAGRAGEVPRAIDGETVLVVDDEPTVRMLVADVLSDLGYAAIEAEDGASGLRVLESGARVDLLVTDVGLPGGMNGRQVADAARVLRPGLRVLFITGYAENAVVGNGHLEPGMEVLTKPFAIEDLADRIRRLID